MHVGSPALTLAMLNKGQLDEFMVDKGGLHELQRSNTQSWLNVQSLQVCVCVCVYVFTSIVTVCVSEGTHSRASSEQQPPQIGRASCRERV